MSNRTLHIALLLLAASAGPPATAQSPTPMPLTAPTFDRLLVDTVDGVIWARGSDYKASFSEKGVSFIPFLGSHAPRNFPVTLTLAGVTAGGEAVAIARAYPAAQKGSQVTIERGSLEEIYELSLGQVEQLFRFERPVGEGDLVVRLAAETELEMSAAVDGGIDFANELGGVRYGKAVVVDAAGRRAGLTTAIEGGGIEITVPADFLEVATWPVTIDPTFITFGFNLSQVPGSQSQWFINADVAYEATTMKFMVSYESVYSASDHDVYVISYTVGQSPVPSSPTATIDFTGQNWKNPKIASSGLVPQFLVVAEHTLSGGAVVIGGRQVSAINFLTSGQFQISSGEVGQKANPDVGGDPSGHYCVVWQNTPPASQTHVYFRLVSVSGTLFTSNILGIVSGLYNDSHPSISKSNRNDSSSAYQDWMVVFQRTAGTGNEDIWGSRIHWDGTVLNDGFPIDTSSLSHTLPQVSTQGEYGAGVRRFVAVYEEHTGTPPFGVLDTDIVGVVLDGSSVVSGPVNLTTMFVAPANDDQLTPSIDGDGTRFAVTFTEKGSPFATEQGKPYVACLHLNYGNHARRHRAPGAPQWEQRTRRGDGGRVGMERRRRPVRVHARLARRRSERGVRLDRGRALLRLVGGDPGRGLQLRASGMRRALDPDERVPDHQPANQRAALGRRRDPVHPDRYVRFLRSRCARAACSASICRPSPSSRPTRCPASSRTKAPS